MTTKLLPLIIVLFAVCLVDQNRAQVPTCDGTATSETCIIPVVFYDQAPDHMNHARYPASWWKVGGVFNDFPLSGSCGTANNSMGWSNTDFELPLWVLQNITCCSDNIPIINGEKGLAGSLCPTADGYNPTCGRLRSDDLTPQYAYGQNRSPAGQVSSANSFYSFFHPVIQTFPVNYNFTLTTDPTQPGLRSYVNLTFFPLDGLGWNDSFSSLDYNKQPQTHNYAFCMVMHTHFTHNGDEMFHFLGDDDVYVYVNQMLVMDLGGVHTALNSTFHTKDLNLTIGTSYRFDFFYCERHTTSSEITFETTISFFCPYTDWCGQCSGTGQSCCGDLCDDGNPCTIDSCDANLGNSDCHHVNVTCPPSTLCTNSYCDAKTGACVTSNVTCDDHNACTENKCSEAGGCYFPPINCNSSNLCLSTGCNALTGCTAAPAQCPNTNLCMNNTCSPTIGCLSTPIPCQTFNVCQSASCSPSTGVCSITSKPPCNDNDMCTIDSCDPVHGCISTPINVTAHCGVSDHCTQWSCDSVKGCVSNTPPCNASDLCHSAYCDPKLGCQQTSVSCPGDQCGTSVCSKATGKCVYTHNPPCPSQSCQNVSCNATLGCVYTPVTCTAPATCTGAKCVNDQCVNYTIQGTAQCGSCGGVNCSSADPCNPQVCVNNVCQPQPVNCTTYNACIKGSCHVVNGQAQCVQTPVTCNGGDACSPQTCNPSTGKCAFLNNITCDDENPCTNDLCVVTGPSTHNCSYAPLECFSEDEFCHPTGCQGGVCVNLTLPDCTDGNTCTFDICSNGACSNPPVCPDSGNLCDPIVCNNGTCVSEPVNCTVEGNLCAVGTCDPSSGTCKYAGKDCNGTTCAPSSCDPASGLCAVPPLLDCNDNNPCTLDTLTCSEDYGFVCNNSDISSQCNSNNACLLDFCNASMPVSNVVDACYHTNVSCVAPSICTVVTGCNATSGCMFGPRICPAPTDWCKVSICDDIAGCITVPRACAPSDNYCYAGTCDNSTQLCGEVKRPNWETITGQNGQTCLLIYSDGVKAGLAAGVIAAIVIAAVVAAALIAYGGKKGVDIFMASRAGPIGGAHSNPIYDEYAGKGNNPMYNP